MSERSSPTSLRPFSWSRRTFRYSTALTRTYPVRPATQEPYNVKSTQECVISESYAKLLSDKIKQVPNWGATGFRQAPKVEAILDRVSAKSMLDYGCGNGSLVVTLKQRQNCPQVTYFQYDPGRGIKVPGGLTTDVVTCIDVMEHVEEDKVDAVLKDIASRAGKVAYFLVSTTPAIHKLPDGTNAHITVHPFQWWQNRMEQFFPWVDLVMEKSTWFIAEACHDRKYAA